MTKGQRNQVRLPDHLLTLDRAIVDNIQKPKGGRLLVSMPPRHGKSNETSRYLPPWYIGTFPDRNVILASYEARFAASFGRFGRDTLQRYGEEYFGVQLRDDLTAANEWQTFQGGGMQTAGIGGAMTGKGANLLVIDDPFKNWKEADSQKKRDDVHDWFKSTAYTRLEPNGTIIVIHTRWHEDDLIGRLMKDTEEKWDVIRFPAINDQGQALWPQRFPIERLNKIKASLGSYLWNALYQQSPIPPGGAIFKREWLSQFVDDYPREARSAVRYWDKAGSDSNGDYSCGVLMVFHDGIYYVADVVHGKWSPFERNKIIYQTAELDKQRKIPDLQLWVEQEPGNGGKESGLISARDLAPFGAQLDHPTTNKVIRARPFSAQCEAGNVRLIRAEWNSGYIDELVHFDKAPHDDRVDGSSGAFNKLVLFARQQGRATIRSSRPRR